MIQWFRNLFARKPVEDKAAAVSLPPIASAGGMPAHQPDFAQAGEALLHYTGSVYACARLTATRIGGLDICCAQKVRGKSARRLFGPADGWKREFLPRKNLNADQWQLVDDHAALRALQDPNPLMTGEQLLAVTSVSLDLTGWGHWWLFPLDSPDEDGRDVLINYLPTNWVRPNHKRAGPHGGWDVQPAGASEPVFVPRDLMCTFRLPSPRDPFGATAPLFALGRAVSADENIERAQANYFDLNAHPGLMFKIGAHPDLAGSGQSADGRRATLTAEQREQLIRWVRDRHRGAHRYGEPIILDSLIEDVLAPPGASAKELDFLRSSQVSQTRVEKGFNIPSASLGQLENANRASSAVAELHLAANVVNPRARVLSQSITQWLGPLVDDGPILIYLDPARPTDPEIALQERAQYLDAGVLEFNEWRAFAGLPPMPAMAGYLVTRGGLIPPSEVLRESASFAVQRNGVKCP